MIPIRDEPQPPRRTFPYVMLAILIVNVLVFLYEVALGADTERFIVTWGVTPSALLTGRESPLNLVTMMFVHGGLLHIAGNMLYLWIFGDNVEDRFGHAGFLVFYLLAGLGAAITHILLNPGSSLPSIGASGAIAGVLAAYVVMFPRAMVRTVLFIGPFITMPRVSAIILIGFWFLIQVINGLLAIGARAAETSGVAFWAHVGGFVAGLILVRLFDRGQERPFVSY